MKIYTTPSKKIEVGLEDSNLVVLRFLENGESDEEHTRMANDIHNAFERIKSEHQGTVSFNVLVDLSKAGLPSAGARTMYIKTLSDKAISKTAFFGAPSSIQAVVSFIVSAAGRGEEVRFFVNEKEAREWLSS